MNPIDHRYAFTGRKTAIAFIYTTISRLEDRLAELEAVKSDENEVLYATTTVQRDQLLAMIPLYDHKPEDKIFWELVDVDFSSLGKSAVAVLPSARDIFESAKVLDGEDAQKKPGKYILWGDSRVEKADDKVIKSMIPLLRNIQPMLSEAITGVEIKQGKRDLASVKIEKVIGQTEIIALLTALEKEAEALSVEDVRIILEESAFEGFDVKSYVVAFGEFATNLGKPIATAVIEVVCIFVLRGTQLAKILKKCTPALKERMGEMKKHGLRQTATDKNTITIGRTAAAFPQIVCWVMRIAIDAGMRTDPVDFEEARLPSHFRFSSFPSLADNALWETYEVAYKEYMVKWLGVINSKKTPEQKAQALVTQESITKIQRSAQHHVDSKARYKTFLRKKNVSGF